MMHIDLCFVCESEWEGKKKLGKKEGVSGRNIGCWKEGLWGLIFLQNIKPSSFVRTKKLHWRRVLGGLRGFI